MNTIKLFVYGSLKHGFFLHYRLRDSLILGRYHVVEGMTLYSLYDQYPVAGFKNRSHVRGELYLVPEDIFEDIARIEFGAGYNLATIGDDIYFFIMDDAQVKRNKCYMGKKFYEVGPAWTLGYRPESISEKEKP